ncbi:MAG: PKD domain-containing protein [Thermoanaerobaculia bacterium]|nr:PKD domain-containing protein [Thermoanaerobaculia bacterium]MBP7812543.1 PKD domain-containing protein [Thermoanaerobaculia bacterium]
MRPASVRERKRGRPLRAALGKGIVRLLAGALLLAGTAFPAHGQSCIHGRTPAVPVPPALGLDPGSGLPVFQPLSLMQDATKYDGTRALTSQYPLTTNLTIVDGWIFNSIFAGFQIWDARGALADSPAKVKTIDGWKGEIPIFRAYSRENTYDLWGIDAVPDPNQPGSYLIALVGDNGTGISIWSWNGTTLRVLYQDGDLDVQGDYRSYRYVHTVVLGGRAWAFAGALPGWQQPGVHLYDLSAAAALSTTPCLEDRASGIAACSGVYKGVPITTPTHYLSGAQIGGKHYLIRANPGAPKGLEIYDVSTPTAPVLKASALSDQVVYGVEIWEHQGRAFAAARVIARPNGHVAIWELTNCLANGCGTLPTPTRYDIPAAGSSFAYPLRLSWHEGRPMLFAGHGQTCFESIPQPHGQYHKILDMSDALHPVDVSPGGTMVDQGYTVDYWSWYYAHFYRGFAFSAPMDGVFFGQNLYRSHLTILDAHRFTPAAAGPPVADFSWQPATVYPGTPVSFTDQSSGLPTSWQWSFTGGSPASSTAQNPVVSFASPGSKSVTLEATNVYGTSAPKTKSVQVLSPQPAIGTIELAPPAPKQCQTVTFSPSSVTGQPPLTYAWSLSPAGGGPIATGSGTTLVWNSATGCPGAGTCPAGAYVVDLQVSNTAGSDTESRQFQLAALPPLPGNGTFAPTHDPFSAGLVQFHLPEVGATEWNWSFGDGHVTGWVSDPVTGPNPTHTYTALGQYSVTVQVRNCTEGPVTSAPLVVSVTQLTPLVAAFVPLLNNVVGIYQATVNVPITFEDLSSGAERWDYDWNGDGFFEQSNEPAPVTTHTYTQIGMFTPNLKVWRGSESAEIPPEARPKIDVRSGTPPPPASISVSGPSSGQVNQPLTFTATATNCTPTPDGWTWTKGGGTGDPSGNTITLTWSTSGTKTITAKNSACGTAIGSKSVAISGGSGGNLAASFTFSPSTPAPGQSVSFDASASTGSPTGYYWTFGDGSAPVSSGTPTTSHTFANAGTFAVTLEVSKPGQECPLGICTASTTRTVTVSGAQPVVSVSGPQTGGIGQSLSFSASATNCTPSANGWLWTTDGAAGSSTTSTITLVWETEGEKTITAKNSACGTATGRHTVSVSAGGSFASHALSPSPAATLLVPYFEVDLARGTDSETTLVAVSNESAAPVLTSWTLWTDWGIPTLTFNVYLSGYGTQTVNLRDVLGGVLPVTGPLSSNRHDPEVPEVAFPGCGGLDSDLPLPVVDMAELRALHQGLASPKSGLCAGSGTAGEGMAVGYVTVDVVNACSLEKNPSSPGYFVAGGRGVASNANVLLGDYFQVNPYQNSAQGDVAVHVRADAEAFGSGYTFYGRFVAGSGADNRQPLGATYGSRYMSGGAFDGGTTLLVWRDPKAPSAPVACGKLPSWAPLRHDWAAVFDEAGHVTLVQEDMGRFPWATQRIPVGGEGGLPIYRPFGRFVVDLSHDGELFGEAAQGWVGVTASAERRYSIGMPAQVLAYPENPPLVVPETGEMAAQSTPPATTCEVEASPAATLLVPYFEVDLEGGTDSETTLVAVSNESAAPVLTSWTLWTDWGIPTLTFNVYLSGYGTQTVNLRDVLGGVLPVTGPLSSNRHDPEVPEVAFPGCGGLDSDLPLPVVDMAELRALHQGLASPKSGLCAGSGTAGEGMAVGYVTVDVVNACSLEKNPSSPGYFVAGGRGVASNANVLLGDYFQVNPYQNSAQGDVAVHVRADAEAFGSGYTFYGRFVAGSGADNRQPLGATYGSRYMSGGAFDGGTTLLVWRDPKAPSAPVACGKLPSWAPLRHDWAAVFDEAGHVTLVQEDMGRFPWATQRIPVGGEGGLPIYRPFGRFMVDLSHDGELFGEAAQGWVGVTASAERRYSIGMPAQVLRTICNPER